MEDEELDYWPISVWADPTHVLHDRLAEELADATHMDDDEMVACFAWLQDPTNRFAELNRQCTAEDIATLFEDHLVEAHSSWAWFAEQWADAQRAGDVVTKLMSAARELGQQDVLFEIMARMGEKVAESQRNYLWWFHVSTLLDGRVFALERPLVPATED